MAPSGNVQELPRMSTERWERTKQILEEALRIAPEKQAAYLEVVCGADSELRAEVESLIASYAEAGSEFLAAAGPELLDRSSSVKVPKLPLNQLIGHYRLVEEAGRGAMGVVYKAEDTRLHRFVALKFLPEEVGENSVALARFRREAKAASALNHPNIVTIYEVGQDGSTHYIAMELIEGKTLRELLVASLLPIRKAIEIAAQVADGLAKAHEGGIAHRDLKPETLMAILREQAEPIGVQNPDAPAPLCWAIERCLAKEPDKRYVSTRDLARELAAIRDCFSEKPVKRVEPRPTNIPVQRTRFVGREKEVAAAKELLLRQDVRLVTVTGPGGIGKTRLAVEVASGLVERFPDGIHFVPLSPLSDPGLITSVIVQTLGIREAGSQSPLEILKKNLQDSLRAPMLLLLDNFEHLIQAAPTVAELLAMGPNLKILVTSRAALHVYGEHEFPVPPLALPDSRSMPPVEVLSQYPAVALFVQRAVAAKPDFELSGENARAVTEICARLDGLPLAIELAAARVKVLSPSSMLTRLASRLQLLTGGARDLPTRQQTLRGAIDWSYDLLNAAEQKLFRRLSVFVGGCTLERVEAVCDAKGDLDLGLLDGMASMVDKSLLQQVEQANGESRFVMLATIREYALEKLAAGGEEDLTKRAHAAYCLVLAEEEATEQSGAEGAEWLERFALEHDNFRAGLEWLTETGDAEWGLRLGAALVHFWETREYLAEGRDRLGKLLKIAGAAAPTKARARALFAAGVLAGEQGDYASADVLISESLGIARQLRDKQGVAVSLNALAVFARDRGNVALAHSLFEESLVPWRELGDQKAIARSLSNLANVVKLQGDYPRARSLYAECLSIFRALGDRTGVAWSLNYQGDVARDQGDSPAARTLYEQGLAIFQELGDRWGIAGTLADLGSLAREQRNYPTAHSLYRESLKIFQELEHKRGIARLLECFACSAAAQLEAERSLRLAGAAAALRQSIGAPLTPAEQAKLESTLDPARQVLTNTAGTTAWLEGWAMPLEKAIEEVLMPHSAARSFAATRGPDEPVV